MANADHVARLKQGPAAWNARRAENDIAFVPDLHGADLSDADLNGADLRDADQSHEAGRSHPPRVRAWALQAPPRFKRRPSRFARATGAAPD